LPLRAFSHEGVRVSVCVFVYPSPRIPCVRFAVGAGSRLWPRVCLRVSLCVLCCCDREL